MTNNENINANDQSKKIGYRFFIKEYYDCITYTNSFSNKLPEKEFNEMMKEIVKILQAHGFKQESYDEDQLESLIISDSYEFYDEDEEDVEE